MRRVVRTERSALIQTRCVQCGFTTIGVKERIDTFEKEHPGRCKGSARPNLALDMAKPAA
jgi:hypothetical protein